MAFLGTPVVTMPSDRECVIKSEDADGLQLGPSEIGTIGLSTFSGAPPDIALPAEFLALAYVYAGNSISLIDAIDVQINLNRNGLTNTNLVPAVIKSGAGGAFRIQIVNSNTGANTQGMEIRVQFMGAGLSSEPAIIA